MACPSCGREHNRSKNGRCPRCYKRDYTSTPTGKAAYDRAKATYEASAKGRETRRRWLPGYRVRRGEYVHPDVHLLREAVKGLEETLAGAERGPAVHGAGE